MANSRSHPPFDRDPKKHPSLRSAFLQAIGFSLLATVVICLTLRPLFTPSFSNLDYEKAVIIEHEGGNRVPDFGDIRWAQASPFRPVEEYRAPPEGCEITQVNLLERHAARYPTKSATIDIKSALAKMQAVPAYSDEKYAFIRDFVYDMGTDELMPFGGMQAREHGEGDYARYKHLFGGEEERRPFVRAAGMRRVVESAGNWTTGFTHASNGTPNAIVSLVIPEHRGVNNSLHNNLCLHKGDSTPQRTAYLASIAPSIRARLASLVLPSTSNSSDPFSSTTLNLTDADIPPLISLCPFHSLATLTLSPFCALFTPSDFTTFEYFHDIKKYYHNGYGAPLGPVQGIAYISELIARLTRSPVRDRTQTNRTLDSGEGGNNLKLGTFPLGRSFYADFSHDREIVGVMSAMGLFRDEFGREGKGVIEDGGKEWEGRRWRVREMVPFSGRMVVERLACSHSKPSAEEDGEEGEYVRVLVNDRVMPLEFCEGVSGDGVCRLNRFVESQGYTTRGGDGDWEKCFV